MSESLQSVEEVADYLGMSTKWVYRNALRLGGIRVGRCLRFRRGNVDKFLESQTLSPRRRGGDVVAITRRRAQ